MHGETVKRKKNIGSCLLV